MCGVFGFINNNSLSRPAAQKLAEALAIKSQIRGRDATGYAILNQGQIEVYKKPVPASRLTINLKDSDLFLGHTRFATMGNPTDESQAHPFLSTDKNIALAHNGIAHHDFYRLRAKYELSGQIDSEGILSFLEKTGFQEAGFKKMFKEWPNSSIALTLLVQDKSSIVLSCNEDRPIWFTSPQKGLFVYASTREILISALSRAGLNFNSACFRLNSFVRLEVTKEGALCESHLR